MEKNVFEKAMETLLAKVDSSEKFVLDQAPEVCRQLILEKRTVEKMDAIFQGLLFLVLSSVSFWASNKALYGEFERYSDARFAYILIGAIGGIFSAISLGCFYGSIQNLIRLKIAPKAFLLREFKSLLHAKDE